MTKLKNTKKGMAKKALSISLVAAMLATSNVPVWAAEFTDGTDVVEAFTADEAPVMEEAPVVEETEEAPAARAIVGESAKYNFNNIELKDGSKDFRWDKVADGALKTLFKDSSVITDSNTGNPADEFDDLRYAYCFDGSWDNLTVENNTIRKANLSEVNFNLKQKTLQDNAGKSFQLLILEKGTAANYSDAKVVCTVDFGTIQKMSLADAGYTASVPTQTYDGLEHKIIPIVNGSLDATAFNWEFRSTVSNYVDASANITAIGKLLPQYVTAGFGDELTVNYTIEKRTLNDSDVVVKVKNPDKDFVYENNAATEVDKTEVDVFLRDLSEANKDKVVASNISLNEYVKKVTLDTTALGSKGLKVEFDADLLKASKNFNGTAPTGVASTDENNKEAGAKDTVDVTAIELNDCEVTLKSPLKADSNNSNIKDAIKVVVKKNGKVLPLATDDLSFELASGDYSKPGTYTGVITVKGTGKVKGSKTIDLVTTVNVFGKATFENANNGWDYITEDPAKVGGRAHGLDYNNGKAVEFADMFSEKCVLGRFSPDNSNFADQSNYRVTYDNNVNATYADSVAKMTVTAVAGDYKGCSQDFYFRIDPSKVVAAANDTNTVNTAITKEAKGVALNEEYTSAAQYAEAIGLEINGTNGKTGDDKITSNATAKDYDIEYSFVDKTHASAGENEVGNKVKIVATLKANGNFVGINTVTDGIMYKNGVSAVIANNVITLYVPIVEKSIENLDITLKEDTFTFTGEMIAPEVIVKENGKVLKDAATIEGISDGINTGTATITVSVDGYSGTKELKATINPAKLSDVLFEIKEGKEYKYTGKQQKPVIAQEDDKTTTKDETITETAATADVKLGKVIVSQMFDIAYGKNIDAGKEAGIVTLTPKAAYAKNFDGTSLNATFEILRAVFTGTVDTTLNIKDATGKKVTITNKSIKDKMSWTGDAVEFKSATVDAGKLTVDTNAKFNDEDYEVVYVNNVDASNDGAKAYVAVIGKGNFTGEYSIVRYTDTTGYETEVVKTVDAEKDIEKYGDSVEILQRDVIVDSYAEFEITGRTFGAKDITYTNGVYAGGVVVKPVVTVKDTETGKVLVEDTDYTVVVYPAGVLDYVNASSKKLPFIVVGKGQYAASGSFQQADGKEFLYSIDKKDLEDCFVNVTLKNGRLVLTVKNGNVTEMREDFDVTDNGDGTATVSVVDGGKNYTGSVSVKIDDPAAIGEVGQAMIDTVNVVNNKATVVLSGEVDNATGYDYVISTEEDYKNGRLPNGINKNILNTSTDYYYLQKGTYYAYCHAWTRGTDGKKVFGDWSNIFKFTVSTTTPDQPVITSVKVSGSTVKVTYTQTKNATGYDVVLGGAVKKVHGEKRPVAYGTLVSKVKKGNVVTATFKNVKKGTYYAGLHAYNRTSVDNKKVFSPWSNVKKVVVK